MNIKDMTTDQIKACLFVHDETRRNFEETSAKLREAGIDEGYIRVLDMEPFAYEWADDLRDELKRREELEGVMQAIYLNNYPDPSSDRIQPLTERAQWEQDQVRRQAEAVISFLKPEPLAQWEIDLLNSGTEEK